MLNIINNFIIFAWVSFFSSRLFANEELHNSISGLSLENTLSNVL